MKNRFRNITAVGTGGKEFKRNVFVVGESLKPLLLARARKLGRRPGFCEKSQLRDRVGPVIKFKTPNLFFLGINPVEQNF